MFPIIVLLILGVLGLIMYDKSGNQMSRMTLSYGKVQPYPTIGAPKPKGKGKDKFMHLMARVKYSGVGIVGMSKKIQGTVFLSNNIARVWRKPNNVRNSFTQLVRGIFSGTSTAWKTLTAAEISGWITAATLAFSKKTFGTAYPLKGNTFFQRVNNTLTSLGLSNITAAPGIATPAFVVIGSVAAASVGGGSFGITITEFAAQVVLPAGAYMKVYATRQTDIGKSSFSKSAYRLIGFIAPAASTNPADIFTDYTTKFGGLVLGQKIGLAVEIISHTVSGPTSSFGASGKFYSTCIVAV
jgi:hypothetical protein